MLKLSNTHAHTHITVHKVCYIHKEELHFLSFISVAQRRLGFLNKDGIDRFGNIKLFAPLKKSSAFKKEVESVRDVAMYFQAAYNGIKDAMNEQDNLRQVLKALPNTAAAQVRAQKARLEAAKEVSIKEKELYKSVSFLLFFS